MTFNLTKLREIARDLTDFDFVFGLECCYGGNEDLKPFYNEENPDQTEANLTDNKIMETIAAGEDEICVWGDRRDWSWEYAARLEHEEYLNAQPMSVEEIHNWMCHGLSARPDVWRRETGEGKIVLPRLKK